MVMKASSVKGSRGQLMSFVWLSLTWNVWMKGDGDGWAVVWIDPVVRAQSHSSLLSLGVDWWTCPDHSLLLPRDLRCGLLHWCCIRTVDELVGAGTADITTLSTWLKNDPNFLWWYWWFVNVKHACGVVLLDDVDKYSMKQLCMICEII